MFKNGLFIIAIVLILFSGLLSQELPGFRVIGRHLYDSCGERVILRGVANPNIWFERDGMPRYEEIEKTGANVVRIVWETKGSASQLDTAITNCIQFKMIPMIELHDATGNWSKLQQCVDYWTRGDVVDVILKHEEYLLLNIANESGDYSISPKTFRDGYETIIKQMRDADIRVPLVIDGTDWGKNINIMQSEGPYLIEADPDHNLIFSVHMWWPKMYGFKEEDIINEIAESVKMELPLIVGEFSQMHGSCDEKEITANNSIAYKTIIRECHLNQVGWIAWSWFGNCNPFWDMSSKGTFETLYDWGLEVAVTDSFSIKNTSVRPYSIVNGKCDPAGVETKSDLINPERFELKQNYPNPFNLNTQINFNVFSPAFITLDLYNMKGHIVKRLVNDWRSTGNYTVQWNGQNDTGDVVASGIYICQLTVKQQSEIFNQSNKLVLLK